MDSGDCCNTRFTCPDSVFEIFPDKCQHHGCLYGYSEKVGESILPSCVSEATCVESLDGPKFQLTREEPMPIEDDCLPQYTLENTCNPRGKICDPAEKEKLTKCYVRGEEYYEGQLFTPNLAPVFSKSCYRCICDANYNNDTLPASNANCRKLQCGIELTNIDQIRKGCVPVYASLTLYDAEPTTCCPIEYMCRKFRWFCVEQYFFKAPIWTMHFVVFTFQLIQTRKIRTARARRLQPKVVCSVIKLSASASPLKPAINAARANALHRRHLPAFKLRHAN